MTFPSRLDYIIRFSPYWGYRLMRRRYSPSR
nr:MAG TPA: hypothetical protein [Caudoviricetes sp.]